MHEYDGKGNITSNFRQVLTSFPDCQVIITTYDFSVFSVFKYRRRGEKDQNLDNISCCGGVDLPWNRYISDMEV